MQRWHRDFLCLVVLGFWGLTLTPDFLAQPWLKWWTFSLRFLILQFCSDVGFLDVSVGKMSLSILSL